MPYSSIIVPKVAEGFVSHQTNLGVDSYDLNELYSPDTGLWKSKVLDLGSPKYPPQAAAAPTRYWFDRSRYNNHGTITGATWQQLPSGVYALNFDGDDKVSIGDTTTFKLLHGALDTTGFQFSIDIWVKITTFASTHYFLGTGIGSSADVGLSFYHNATRILNFIIGRGVSGAANTVIVVTSAANTYPNTYDWVNLFITYDQSLASNNYTLYINGVSAVTGTKTGLTPSTANSTQPLTIGETGSDAFGMTGQQALIRILNRASTASQVLESYQRGKILLRV